MQAQKVNAYLQRVFTDLKLQGNLATSEHVQGSDLLQGFADEMFALSFLLDCLEKGVACQRQFLEANIKALSRKATPEKILLEFSSLYENADVLYIAAYEKFLFFLANCCSRFLQRNTRFLYDSRSRIELSYTELVRGAEDASLLSMMINLKICKSRFFELVTNSDHWIKLLKSLHLDLTDEEESFIKAIHFRRNAASHYHLKQQWNVLQAELARKDAIIWLYGLLLFSVKVDQVLLSDEPHRKSVQLNLYERGRYKFGVWCASM